MYLAVLYSFDFLPSLLPPMLPISPSFFPFFFSELGPFGQHEPACSNHAKQPSSDPSISVSPDQEVEQRSGIFQRAEPLRWA